MLQRASLKALRNTGEVEMAMLIGEPIGMGHGRSCWNVFTAACDFMPLPRISGHTGICISGHILDGGMFSALHKTLSARSKLLYEQDDIAFGPLAAELEAKDWCVGFRCIDHSCCNAIQWALKPSFGDLGKDDVHIAVASCRNGAAGLHSKVDAFVLMCSIPPLLLPPPPAPRLPPPHTHSVKYESLLSLFHPRHCFKRLVP